MEKEKATKTGFGIGTVLFLIFMTLKLAELGVVAKWSWWWVTSPLWIQVLLVVAIIIGYVLIGIIAALLRRRKTNQALRRFAEKTESNTFSTPKVSNFQKRLEEMAKQKNQNKNNNNN